MSSRVGLGRGVEETEDFKTPETRRDFSKTTTGLGFFIFWKS